MSKDARFFFYAIKENKIAKKLSLSFGIVLLVFSLIVGIIFFSMFRKHTLDLHKKDMASKAERIALSLGNYMGASGGQGGYAMFINVLSTLEQGEFWIIDSSRELYSRGNHGGGKGMGSMAFSYAELPENASDMVEEVFRGNVTFTEKFSPLLEENSLTIGVPIIDASGNFLGALLLHNPIDGIQEATTQGVLTLAISLLFALVAALVLSVLFSVSFTKPLNQMKETSLRLAKGDYNAKNRITQQDEIGELARTIDVLSDYLHEASLSNEKTEKLRRDFVANISHELRTPVTVLRGSLEALCDKVVSTPEKVDEYHHQMLAETIYLQRLVGDLLDLSKLQSSEFVIHKEPVDIKLLVEDTIRSVRTLADKKEVSIALNFQVEALSVEGDYGRLRQMLLIFLDNAIKFSPPRETISVTVGNNTISICDRGQGIAVEDLPHIFDRFYKARDEQNKTGTGLGLAIAKQIAWRHDMDVLAENSHGAKFTVVIHKL